MLVHVFAVLPTFTDGGTEIVDYSKHIVRQIRECFFFDVLRYIPYSLGHAAHYGSEGIGIGTETDGTADGILKAVAT